MKLTTLHLVSSKITTVDDFTALALLRPFKLQVSFSFVLVCTMSIFFRSSMCFLVPHSCSKILKICN